MKDYRLYILMRVDLPSQGAGRAAAQASHASNAFWKLWGNRSDAKEWAKQTNQGFGTAIVLGATNEQISEIFSNKESKNYLTKDWVIDPDYVISIPPESAPYYSQSKLQSVGGFIEKLDDKRCLLHRQEKTCAYIFGTKEELAPYIGHLPLYS